MSNVDKLLALGAEIVAGDVLWKHKVLGRFRNGEFIPTEEGLKALDIDDAVEVKPKSRRAKVEAKDDELEVSID
jgi:hypothetical protein